MKKTYIEANYRIDNVIFNTGFICIAGDSIIGIFTLDRVIISIERKRLLFGLFEYNPIADTFLSNIFFSIKHDIEYLESPATYVLKSDSNEILKLNLLKKITNPSLISKLDKEFEIASND